ncbi:MAG TPA: hypothetical protein VGJ82_12220 [Thermoanaerobaculia bacterium]
MTHVATLLREAFEVAEQIRNAPESPVTSYLPAKLRRLFRRNAMRLRSGRVAPKYPNLNSPEDLAAILERTAARDEAIERGIAKLTRILAEVRRVKQYQAAELEEGMRIVYQRAWERAQEDGPGSKAADFLRLFQDLIIQGNELRTLQRRQNEVVVPEEPFCLPGADPAREVREQISAAEILAEPPSSGECVLHFGSRTAEEPPVVMRIGIAEKSWVGSFQRGAIDYSTVQLMPDGAHLLVVACGAGYVIEAATRFLSAEADKDIMEVMRDDDAGVLFIDHAGIYLEAYGTKGRLWKTARIGAGGFRNIELGDDAIYGETQQGSHDPHWIEFSVDLGTGEVEWSCVTESRP